MSIQKKITITFSTMCFLVVFLLHSITYAETKEQLEGTLDTLSAQIKALEDEIKVYSKKVAQTQGEAKTLKQALNALEVRKTGLAKDITYTRLRIKQAESSISFTQNKIKSTESVLEKNKRALAESLRGILHRDNSLPLFVGALAPNARISDTLDTFLQGQKVSTAINEKIQTLTDTKVALSVEKASFEKSKTRLLNLNETLSDQQQLVTQTTKAKASLLAETKNKEISYQNVVAERKKKKSQLESEVLDVEAKIKTIVDVSKLPKYGKGVLQYPLDSVVITQFFGNTPFSSKNPQVYNGSGHNGIDFGVKVGSRILAAQSGVVLGTGDTDLACNGVSYGKWILLQHTNGLSTLYAHLSVIQVKKGEQVSAGQKIGLSGNTGYSTGPHLHFTVYASDAVVITNYTSKVCGTTMTMPIAPRAGYLNPLSYL